MSEDEDDCHNAANAWNEMLADLAEQQRAAERLANAARDDRRNPLDDPNRRYFRTVAPDERGLLSDWDPLGDRR